ncbi:unnamed protein product, partial [marine sediment metagenome]
MFWFLLAVIAGLLNGSFTLPMKFVLKWKWEHTWSMWSFWALFILPVAIAFLTVPDLAGVYHGETSRVLSVFVIGCCWGVGAITFGMGVHYLGMALGFALIMGLTTAVGSLVPLALGQVEDVMTTAGLLIVIGVGIIVLGIAVCSLAGHLKGKSLGNSENREEVKNNRSFLKGLIICIIAGITG